MKYKIKDGDTPWVSKGIFLKDNMVLIVKPTGSKDRYDIPGGKIKIGESKEQGLYRECLEEVGLKVKKVKFLGTNDKRKKHYFIINDWGGEIVLQLEELEKYRWVSLDTVLEYYLTKTAYHGIQMILQTI
tara:strand:- start:12137 stop:12526 length:390 start_codon:yes stop_codon:yes gene_type:complete